MPNSTTTVETPPQADAAPLSHSLKQRHLSMIALGGVIGAGLFVGSGAGIAAAGPSIVVAYTLSGLLVMLVMRMLGEMSARSEEHTSELQSHVNLVCRLLLEKKKRK